MNKELRRESQHQYLVLSDNGKTIEPERYEFGMLLSNRIPLLLPLTLHSFNGETMLYYDVSGKKRLSEVLLADKADKELMTVILSSFAEVLDNMEEYLLGTDTLCTDPECIFLDLKENKLLFACCPAFLSDFTSGMVSLSETLIGRLNHKDRDAVLYGYQFYQASCDGRLTSDFLRELIYQEKSRNTSAGEAGNETIAKAADVFQESSLRQTYGNENYETMFLKENAEGSSKAEETREKGFFKRLFFSERRKRKTERKKEAESMEAVKEERQSFLPQPSEETAPNISNEDEYRTMLLKRPDINSPFVIAWLIPVELFTETSVALYEDEYLIGKANAGAGICLNSDKVSRIHARLKRKGITYTAVDLSSVNGTFLNGRRMKSGEEYLLSSGDEISFADAGFRFCLTADDEKEYT